jgi:hypothetical protein
MLIIIYVLDHVRKESLDKLINKQYEKYMGDPLRDHGKMGVGLLKCVYFEKQSSYRCQINVYASIIDSALV